MYELAIAVQIIAVLFCAIGTFLLYRRIDKAISKNLLAFIAVLTSEYHNYYYKSKTFVEYGLFPHIETKNSPWFYTFMVVLLLCMVYSTALYVANMVISARKARKVNWLSIVALAIGIAFMWVSFGVGFNGYEPISAIVCTILGITSIIMMGSKNSVIINQAYAESYMKSSIGQVIATGDNRFLECNDMPRATWLSGLLRNV